jgi:MFS family permease
MAVDSKSSVSSTLPPSNTPMASSTQPANPAVVSQASAQKRGVPWTTAQFLNLTMGAVGIQFAWSSQLSLSSRVLEPLGADPFLYGLIWCAGPVTGILVQPIIGAISDKTWTRFGRRRPFILSGAILGAISLFLFPMCPQLVLAALCLWVIDACVNAVQGPYRALIPDAVPESQTGIANACVNTAIGLGAVVSLGLAPLLKSVAGIDMSVTQQYWLAAVALFGFVLYTSLVIREPEAPTAEQAAELNDKNAPFWDGITEFLKSSKEIHKISAVQFFTWLALMCQFMFLTPFVVHNLYQLPERSSAGFEALNQLQTTLAKTKGLLATEGAIANEAMVLSADAEENQTLLKDLVPSGKQAELDTLREDVTKAVAALQKQGFPLSPKALTETGELKAPLPFMQAETTIPEGLPAIPQAFALVDSKATVYPSQIAEALILSQSLNVAEAPAFLKPYLTQLQASRHLEPLEAQATETAQKAMVVFNLMALLFSIPLGALTRKLGKKLVHTLTLSSLTAAMILIPFCTTPTHIMLTYGLAGLAWATILSIPFAILCDNMSRNGHEGSIMGIFNIFVAAPQLLAATVVSSLILQTPQLLALGSTYNYRIAFTVAAVSVVVAILILQTIREKAPVGPASASDAA